MNILIIGGTRNVGHFLALELLSAGHTVTMLNRGKTPDHLPDEIERLRADRTDSFQLEKALIGREFDVVVDNALYKQQEAETIIRLLNGRVGHYIFLSSGQVYLVREGAERPFSEDSYEGRLIPAPKANTFAYEEWLYGIDKRKAEDAIAKAGQDQGFPFTSLRLPMVNGERDHFSRLYSYVLRLKDGGPILVPETPDFIVRLAIARSSRLRTARLAAAARARRDIGAANAAGGQILDRCRPAGRRGPAAARYGRRRRPVDPAHRVPHREN